MKTIWLVALLVGATDGKAIRQRRAIAEYSNVDAPTIVISDTSSGPQSDIDSYKTVLETLLKQLAAIEQNSSPFSGTYTSAELADEYQRQYYTQAASEIVQKLIEYGALSAVVDAENAAFTDGEEESKEGDVIRVAVNGDESVAPNSGDTGDEDEFTDEQAHAVLKMIIEQLLDKFFEDAKNTAVFVLGAESKKGGEEDSGEDDSSSSSSSSEADDEYYFGDDSDEEYDDFTIDTDDEAVYVVNKQVSTNIIRIPTATFVEALTKLLPALRTSPAQLQQLTPLQIEDSRVYAEHGELIGPKPTESVHPTPMRVSPIVSVAPTAESARHAEMRHYEFDLGHVLVCIAAALLILWALVQLYAMYKKRGHQTAGPAPAMALPPKVIPNSSIIPNIYATPPSIRHPPPPPSTVETEKPPVYAENPSKSDA